MSEEKKEPEIKDVPAFMQSCYDWLEEMEDALVLEPRERFDKAIIGWIERCSQPNIICYDVRKVIDIFKEEDGMTEEEAWEFYSYNTAGAWYGDGTPCFLHRGEE